MKKALTLIAILAILFGISKLFIQGKNPGLLNENTKIDIPHELIKGKWVNKADGYKVNNESENRTERYISRKTYSY